MRDRIVPPLSAPKALQPADLASLAITERMEAEQTALVAARGLDYREIAVVGTFDAGRARLERLTLDAP
jgi:hypothetical protein